MKRASTKKVNAIPAYPANQDALEGHLSSVPLGVNRRARTSAAMIGLAISMGASSILLTRQSDRVAAEPLGNEPTVKAVSVAKEDAARKAVATSSQMIPEVNSSGNGSVSSTVAVPTQVMPTGDVVVPTTSETNQPVQGGQTLWQLSQTYQVDAVAVNAYNNLAEQSDLQPRQTQQATVANRADGSESTVVVPSAIGQATSGSQQSQAGDQAVATGEVNALLKARQAVALNRLKQKSNRLQDSLAELRSEELKHDVATPAVIPADKSGEAQASTPNSEGVTAGAIDEASRKLPTGVEETTAVVSVAVPDYQVRKGDTLSTIARSHGVTLAELISINHLTDPNRLQIDQQLTIPATSRSLVSRTVATNEDIQESPQPGIGVTTGGLKYGDKSSVVAVVPSAGTLNENGSVSVTNSLKTGVQTKASSIGHRVDGSNLTRMPVVASLLPNTPQRLTTEVHSSAGTIPFTSSTRQAQNLSASEQPLSPYVENLRLEILKLREKYQSQQAERQTIPAATETGSVAAPVVVPAPSTTANSSQPLTLEFKANGASERVHPFAPGQVPLTSKSSLRKEPATKNIESTPIVPQVATAPVGINAFDSLHSLRGQQVSPELPPLAAVDRYLPKPIDTSAPFREGFIWPAKGLLTSGFGWRWGRMHKGIDIAAPIGTPVVAAAAGVVVTAGWNSGGYGNLVDIQHPDGSLTRYAHNNRILVQVGQQVEQGEQISEMGSTGYSTGPHCHFEVHPPGHGAVNPIAFLPSR